MAVVIDEAFFGSLVGLDQERHLSNAEIAWFVVGYDQKPGRAGNWLRAKLYVHQAGRLGEIAYWRCASLQGEVRTAVARETRLNVAVAPAREWKGVIGCPHSPSQVKSFPINNSVIFAWCVLFMAIVLLDFQIRVSSQALLFQPCCRSSSENRPCKRSSS